MILMKIFLSDTALFVYNEWFRLEFMPKRHKFLANLFAYDATIETAYADFYCTVLQHRTLRNGD